ncbi:bifunctional 2-polyprenyl-6-hydroxyphenol methylase/3-demethylubiquinol 3-O-methyltransferase UbiG [Desulforhopalus sp. IMCC35007]|uniref:class I SAM-dependent methyltransferase n=1 Tax=Desulforhopalus sp. IMCC35007 TaxID=2569543 RepID=UPI0010ADB4DD|nr:methyltransferase domain-containing protein [Desulforhopalus sp. IMCC35007]TKB05887.1 methyltransferase domain-containing protein [Desulforhopalus sp. IMCC35007]
MGIKDKEKWDARYLENTEIKPPSELLTAFIEHAPLGRALDIACGNGRNSLFMEKMGFTVDAVDISSVALQGLAAHTKNVNPICKDLDDWAIPENSYELIVNIRFLDRRLIPMIEKALKPGGLLIFESFTNGKDDRFCLAANELLSAFASLHILYYEEKKIEDSHRFKKTASLVAIKEELNNG